MAEDAPSRIATPIAVFGIAAFAQPAIGRSGNAGHANDVDLYNDVKGSR